MEFCEKIHDKIFGNDEILYGELKSVYDALDDLYKFINDDELNADEFDNNILIDKVIKEFSKDLTIEDRRLKYSINYTKYCILTQRLIEQGVLSNYIEYYILNNSLKEVEFYGLGHTFDVKYEQSKSNLYRVVSSDGVTWAKWINNNSDLKLNGLQKIFKACGTHINGGGECKLDSYSKCFGISLFKYFKPKQGDKVKIKIINDADTNTIKTNDGVTTSLQNFDTLKDVDENTQFAIDFSNARDDHYENYNKWFKRFLDFDIEYSIKKNSENKPSTMDALIEIVKLEMITNSLNKPNQTAQSSRVSPIQDKEVVVSNNFIFSNEREFDLNEQEAIQLVFAYFLKLLETKSKKSCLECKEKIEKNVDEWIEEMCKVFEEILTIETDEENQNYNVAEIKILKEDFMQYKNFSETSDKVNAILELIDFDKEEIPTWGIDNIYGVDDFKSSVFAMYKCKCKESVVF